MERRDFFRRWGRIVMLGGLAGVGGYLALSGRVSEKVSCSTPGKCGICSLYTSCTDIRRQKK